MFRIRGNEGFQVFLSGTDATIDMEALTKLLMSRKVATADETAIEEDDDYSSSRRSTCSPDVSASSKSSSKRSRK